jgi:radical SAM protein with 4Fe4S-binding SPASM domain
MFKVRQNETNVQSTFEDRMDYWKNQWRRAKGKSLSYLWFKLRWKKFPKYYLVPKFPLNVDVEVSSICNIKCDHCFRQYMDIGENDLMPMNMFENIARECGRWGLFTLKFSMRGEPTMHPQLPEMVALAKKCGVKEVWINSHGGNITEDLAKRLMKAKPDWVTISFDGLGEMYESIRRPLKFEDSLRKLKMLREARDRFNPDAILNVQTLWSAISNAPAEYRRIMGSIVDRISVNSDMNFKEIMLVPDNDFVCPRLWQRIAVTSQGDFLKCPSDFQKEEVLGNIRDMTIKEVWDHQQHAQRLRHLAGRKRESEVCQKCHHGAKKVPRTIHTEKGPMESYSITYENQFSGVGLNRLKDEAPQVTVDDSVHKDESTGEGLFLS